MRPAAQALQAAASLYGSFISVVLYIRKPGANHTQAVRSSLRPLMFRSRCRRITVRSQSVGASCPRRRHVE